MSGATPLRWPGEQILIRQRLSGTPEAASCARRVVRNVDWPNIDTVTLLASELVTNAVRYSRSRWLDLAVATTPDGILHLQVIDEGRGGTTPHLRLVENDGVTGRGLHLVKHFSVRWGFIMDTVGVTVWCDVADAPPSELIPTPPAVCPEEGR